MRTYNVFDRFMSPIGTIKAKLAPDALKAAQAELGVGVAIGKVLTKQEAQAAADKARNERFDALLAQM